MSREEYLPRYRYPVLVIRFSVILHIFVSSRTAALLIFLFFRANVSHKTICDWTNKFNGNVDLPTYDYSNISVLICNVDEKYVKVNGEWNYWWSLKDLLGNVVHAIVTKCRDFYSARKLLIEARKKIGKDVDILVRDGLPAYNKSTKFLGRRCKSVIAGISGKGFIFKKQFYWLTNNSLESLNSEIDFYMGKFQNNFANLESANRFANIFMLRKRLKKCFAEKKLSEASSILKTLVI